MKCEKCKKKFKDKDIHSHHILPYSLFETYECPIIYLCTFCHKKIHEYLDILKYTSKEKVEKFTKDWLKNKKIIQEIEKFPFCPICKDIDKRLSIREVGSNYLILGCSYCGYNEKNTQKYNEWFRRQKKDLSSGNQKLFLKKVGIKKGDEKDGSISKI